MELCTIQKRMISSYPEDSIFKEYLKTININPKRPFGKFNIWAWWIEIVHGCNLACGFCATRLFPRGTFKYMELYTWENLISIIKQIAPYSRMWLANAGEPTLHPDFLKFIKIAKKICPTLQISTYTNGTQLINGKFLYDELFDAGLTSIFVDMYHPFEKHKKLAEDSGYLWYYERDKVKLKMPNVFEYQKDQNIHIIRLADAPMNWTPKKKKQCKISTFLNQLDWKAAKEFGLTPLTKSLNRRCDQPFKYINVNYDGTFPFCCFDFTRQSVHNFGNINNGLKDLLKFWFGNYMQDLRNKLLYKQRGEHEFCKVCNFTSVRCDIPYWGRTLKTEDEFNKLTDYYWTGSIWEKR